MNTQKTKNPLDLGVKWHYPKVRRSCIYIINFQFRLPYSLFRFLNFDLRKEKTASFGYRGAQFDAAAVLNALLNSDFIWDANTSVGTKTSCKPSAYEAT